MRRAIEPDGTIDEDAIAPGAGTFTAIATAARGFAARAGAAKRCRRHSRPKTKKCQRGTAKSTYGTGSAYASLPGTVRISIQPTRAIRRLVRRHQRLTVAVAVSFQSAGGGSATTLRNSIAVPARKRRKG